MKWSDQGQQRQIETYAREVQPSSLELVLTSRTWEVK